MAERDPRAPLVAAALALVAERGSRATSLSDVARRAGVSRTTAYRIFGSKQGLVAAVSIHEAERFLAGLDAAVTADPTWQAALEYTLAALGENTALQRVCRDEPEVVLGALTRAGEDAGEPSTLTILVDAAAAIIDARLDTAILRVDARAAAAWIAHAIVGLLLLPTPGVAAADPAALGDLILHGIARPSA